MRSLYLRFLKAQHRIIARITTRLMFEYGPIASFLFDILIDREEALELRITHLTR